VWWRRREGAGRLGPRQEDPRARCRDPGGSHGFRRGASQSVQPQRRRGLIEFPAGGGPIADPHCRTCRAPYARTCQTVMARSGCLTRCALEEGLDVVIKTDVLE